jgi:hypothetical protein
MARSNVLVFIFLFELSTFRFQTFSARLSSFRIDIIILAYVVLHPCGVKPMALECRTRVNIVHNGPSLA